MCPSSNIVTAKHSSVHNSAAWSRPISSLPCAGFRAAQQLEHAHGIVAEMATDVLVLFMFGIGTTAEHLSRLGDALTAVAAEAVRQAAQLL